MDEEAGLHDAGEWLNFRLSVEGGFIPVRVTREAMEDHFGADKVEGADALIRVYREHRETIHDKVRRLIDPRRNYTRDEPLMVMTKDL